MLSKLKKKKKTPKENLTRMPGRKQTAEQQKEQIFPCDPGMQTPLNTLEMRSSNVLWDAGSETLSIRCPQAVPVLERHGSRSWKGRDPPALEML